MLISVTYKGLFLKGIFLGDGVMGEEIERKDTNATFGLPDTFFMTFLLYMIARTITITIWSKFNIYHVIGFKVRSNLKAIAILTL